jgi:two-component system, NtrC family, nitrogen regulation response regulator GlnG
MTSFLWLLSEKELAGHTGTETSSDKPDADNLSGFMEHYLTQYFSSMGGGLPPEGLYERVLAEIEPPLLRASLLATNGNQLRAADLLGINRNTLRSKLKERNIIALRGFS